MKHNLGSLEGSGEACERHSRQELGRRSYSAICVASTHKSWPLKTVARRVFRGRGAEGGRQRGNVICN